MAVQRERDRLIIALEQTRSQLQEKEKEVSKLYLDLEDEWRRNEEYKLDWESLYRAQEILIQGQEQLRREKEQLAAELEQVRSQLEETKEDCEKQILQRENELAAEFNTLKARLAKADKLAGEIYLLLEQAYYPPEEGGVFRANNGTKARTKVNCALDLLEEFAPKLKDEPFPPG